VTVQGEPPGASVTVEAVVEGTVQDSIQTDADGTFGGPGTFDEKLTVPGESGDQVTFVVQSTDVKTVDWESAANRNVTLEVDSIETDDGDDTTGGTDDGDTVDDGTDGGGGAPAGGGGGAPAGGGGQVGGTQPTESTENTTVAEDPEQIRSIVPDTVTLPANVTPERAAVANVTADETGSSVQFGSGSVARSISFDAAVDGQSAVVEFGATPPSIAGIPGRVITVTQIAVPTTARNVSATIRTGVSMAEVEAVGAEPEDLEVVRFQDQTENWQRLAVAERAVGNASVDLAVETPGFSYFAVTAIAEPAVALDAPGSVAVGESVTFDASGSSTPDGEIVAYDWTVDGEPVSGGETLTHTFETAGEATVEVTVENAAGETNTTTADLTVTESQAVGTTATTTVATTTTDSEGGPGALLAGGVLVIVAALLAALYLTFGRE
jgi:PGF-pre-PGF domain-containing protein